MKALSIRVYHYSLWLLLASLVSLALISMAGRLLLNQVEYFKEEIEQELARYGIKGVRLENIEGQFQGLQPFLRVKGASLSIPGREQSLSVNELSLQLKLVESFLKGELILQSLHSRIERLVLVRDEQGAWWLNDIPLSAEGKSDTRLDVVGFFQRLPAFVDIDIALIELQDRLHAVDYRIQHARLVNRFDHKQLSLQLSAQLPDSLGRRIEIFIKGDAIHQQLYVNAEKLRLERFQQLASLSQSALGQAQLSLKSWIDLKQFVPLKVVSQAKISELLLLPKDPTQARADAEPLQFRLLQRADAEEGRWRIHSEFMGIQKGARTFPDINTQLLLSKRADKPQLWVDRLELSLLDSILGDLLPDESARRLLSGLQAEATLSDVVAEIDAQVPLQSLVGFSFSGLGNRPYRGIPGLDGVDGAVVTRAGQARVRIDAKQLEMDFAGLFRAPLKLDTLAADAVLHFRDSTLYVEAEQFSVTSPDIALSGRLRLEAPANKRPFLSLRADYREGRVDAVHRYLPVAIMPQAIVHWLDAALQGGEVTRGDLLFHGRLQKPALLERQRSGVMHASFAVSNPQLRFLPDWPIATGGEGRVDFLNSGMSADLSRVGFAYSTVDRLNLQIPDLLKARLSIDINTRTQADDLLKTLSRLPILNLFDEVQSKTTVISGRVDSEIRLDIPLSKKLNRKITVTAKADLKSVDLSIPGWMVDFKQLKGLVTVDNERVSAKSLSGLYQGDKMRLSVIALPKAKRTKFYMQGELQSQHLLTLLPDYLRQPVSGASVWDVAVSVGHQPSDSSPLLEISAQSNLLGSRFSFPEPARVDGKQEQGFSFSAELFNGGRFPFRLSLDDRMKASGLLSFADTAANPLAWLNVQLGAGDSIQRTSGVRVKGRLAQLDVNDWFDYRRRYFSESDEGSAPFLQQVQSIDLAVEQMAVGGQQASASKLRLVNDGKQLQGSIDSSLARGSFELPYRMDVTHPLIADLEYIRLKKSTSAESFNAAIADMPNLLITSKLVSYEGMEFDRLILSSRAEADLFVIEQLDLSHDKVQLKSSGRWQFEPQSKLHVSVFNIDIKGPHFGETVNKLGLGETIKGGKVDFNGQVGWNGEIYRINWPSLLGEVSLKLDDGYLRNVDPGAGRFVGLLSFNALPKRLFLDFGDVVKEGMQFNKIRGGFVIKGEQLETENLTMDSVSAKVRVKGATNLRSKTYDQSMVIVPKIGDTLPLIGTLAAGNTVGWGLLLLHKIFKKPIEKSVEIEYKVSGRWDAPQVDLISKPKSLQETDSAYESDY